MLLLAFVGFRPAQEGTPERKDGAFDRKDDMNTAKKRGKAADIDTRHQDKRRREGHFFNPHRRIRVPPADSELYLHGRVRQLSAVSHGRQEQWHGLQDVLPKEHAQSRQEAAG